MKPYIIKTTTGLNRISLLMQELNIITNKDPLIYVKIGYKTLSLQDKETFYLLFDLSQLNKKSRGSSTCRVGLDYLATVFDTTESCQKNRISNLITAQLIKPIDNGYYVQTPPFPDITFIQTLVRLIRRKRLSEYIKLYNNCYNPLLRIELILRIRNIEKKGVSCPGL